MAEGTSMSAHMLQMMSYMAQLEKLEGLVDKGLATDIVLNSLLSMYSSRNEEISGRVAWDA